jgi:uncharacterized RDD family membrane protein YckC
VADLVTGEAVVLELRLAKLASRSLAVAIDISVQLALFLLGTLVLAGTVSFVDDSLAAAIGLVFYVAVIVGYPVAFETLTKGHSLGKMALGLRVVREDGGPIRFRHALVRGLLAVVEIWASFGAIALITSLASARGRRVGDFLAGTVVVHERVPVRAGPVAVMPAPLAGWAARLDLSRVPDDLALAARQYLARLPELAPAVRDEMGAGLVRALTQVTAPPPPPGVPAWAFLSAVLAERRRRELARWAPGPPGAYAGAAERYAGPSSPFASPPPPYPGPIPPAPPPAGTDQGEPSPGDRPFTAPS